MSIFKKKPKIELNADLYKCDEWEIWDKMGEVHKYDIMANQDAITIGTASFGIGAVVCGVMWLTDLVDVFDLFMDTVVFCLGGAVMFWLGAKSIILRYKAKLEEENH